MKEPSFTPYKEVQQKHLTRGSLRESGQQTISRIVLHPSLDVYVTATADGHIQLWDPTTLSIKTQRKVFSYSLTV